MFRAPSADRACNLWLEHTDGHNQQQRATLIHMGVTTRSGTDSHRHTHTVGSCESNSVHTNVARGTDAEKRTVTPTLREGGYVSARLIHYL